MKSFIHELFSELYIDGLCHGNLSEEEAISISNLFKMNFPVQPLPIELMSRDHCIWLPDGANLIRDVGVNNKSETNSLIELYYQIERVVHSDSTRLKVLIDLLYDIVKGPLYDNLRTKEQLGYAVECGPEPSCGVLGFRLCVQSSEYNPSYLQGRLDNFINGLEELLVNIQDIYTRHF